MIKVAILDDYQNVSQAFLDLKKLSGKTMQMIHIHDRRFFVDFWWCLI